MSRQGNNNNNNNRRETRNTRKDEEEEYQPPKDVKRQTKAPSKANRDKGRSDRFREKKGQEFMDTVIKKQVEDVLFQGFEDLKEVVEQMSTIISKNPSALPVTTRGIGFDTYMIYKHIHSTLKSLPNCSVQALYRVSLAQFEMRMTKVTHQQCDHTYMGPENVYRPRLGFEQQQAIEGCTNNFNLIANTIRAVGNFEFSGEKYYPFIPSFKTISPLNVTYTNLRNVVKVLSDRTSPREIRRLFYDNNCLPGALWGGRAQRASSAEPSTHKRAHDADGDDRGDFPLLLNPNDFWPEDVDDDDQLRNDISSFQLLFSTCVRKGVKFAKNTGHVKFDEPGQRLVLVCNKMMGARIPDPPLYRSEGVDLIDWRNSRVIEGGLEEFWAPAGTLDVGACILGMHALVGEVPINAPTEQFAVRVRPNGKISMHRDYATLVSNMLA